MTPIARRIEAVRERISNACTSAGRNPSEITLVAVTKTVSPEKILEAERCGIRDFGENYVQEARPKIAAAPDVRWHFIGHLQSNKAKYIPGVFHLLQSLDSQSLAVELNRRSAMKEITQNVLIEVKLDPSAAKNGIEPALLPALEEVILSSAHLKLMGLMGLPPAVQEPESARPYFERLRTWFEQLPEENRGILSMGMTSDFEAAIKEGSTMVRIGTGIFGHRA